MYSTVMYCTVHTVQLESNISPAVSRGILKLRKRIAEGEIVVIESDKGKTVTVSSMDSYLRQGQAHTANDDVITINEVKTSQRLNTATARMLGNVFAVGSGLGPAARLRVMANLGGRQGRSPTSGSTSKPISRQRITVTPKHARWWEPQVDPP